MGNIVNLLGRDGERKGQEQRRDQRQPFFMVVDYVASGRTYKDFIHNISTGGVFIETRKVLEIGEEISMSFSLPGGKRNVKVAGVIVRWSPKGIGVKFKGVKGRREIKSLTMSDSAFSGKTGAPKEREAPKMGKVEKKRVRWQPSPSQEVEGYRLYWSTDGKVDYDSDHLELKGTSVVLPDDLPAFAGMKGNVALGVTAVNGSGNESDMDTFLAYIDFTVPEAPTDLKVEIMDDYTMCEGRAFEDGNEEAKPEAVRMLHVGPA